MFYLLEKWKIRRFVDKCIRDEFIVPYHLDIVSKIFGSNIRDNCSIIVYKSLLKRTKIEKKINDFTINTKRVEILSRDDSIGIHDKNASKIMVILFSEEGIKEIGEYLTILHGRSSKVLDTIYLFKDELEHYICATNVQQRLAKLALGSNVIISGLTVRINNEIVPDRIWHKGQFIEIPEEYRIPIKQILIKLDYKGRIIGAHLDGQHPNTDEDHNYCLSKLKLRLLNKKIFDHLISNIKIYNLDACFWMPNWYCRGSVYKGESEKCT